MKAWGVRVHGLNFWIEVNGKPVRAGFYTTFFVPGLEEDEIVESIALRLAERIAQDDWFLPSSHSYFQIDEIWDAGGMRQTSGFTFYDMSFAQYSFAAAKAYVLGVLIALGATRSTYRPIYLSARAQGPHSPISRA